MIDPGTIRAYDDDPASYAAEWHAQPPPDDMYALLREFFSPGATADIGCGSGRDTAWLAANGFDPIGYDASEGLLAQACLAYPAVEFAHATLPDLAAVGDRQFTNVLCETVIMHLSTPAIPLSVARLVDLLEPDGTLYLSWRGTVGSDQRDDRGRLYAAFDSALVTDALGGTTVLHAETVTSASSGRVVHRVIARQELADRT